MALKILLAFILLLIFVCLGFIGWLFKNFREFRDITTHNSGVFSSAIAQHSTKIADIQTDLKSATDDLYTEMSEVDKKLKSLETKTIEVTTSTDIIKSAILSLGK